MPHPAPEPLKAAKPRRKRVSRVKRQAHEEEAARERLRENYLNLVGSFRKTLRSLNKD